MSQPRLPFTARELLPHAVAALADAPEPERAAHERAVLLLLGRIVEDLLHELRREVALLGLDARRAS